MTQAERLQQRGFRTLQSQFSTRGSFSISDGTGTLGTFVGIVSIPQDQVMPVMGGDENERELQVVAEREQFTDASVTPECGMSITHQGTRWVIEDIPGQDSDEVCYTFKCTSPVSGR